MNNLKSWKFYWNLILNPWISKKISEILQQLMFVLKGTCAPTKFLKLELTSMNLNVALWTFFFFNVLRLSEISWASIRFHEFLRMFRQFLGISIKFYADTWAFFLRNDKHLQNSLNYEDPWNSFWHISTKLPVEFIQSCRHLTKLCELFRNSLHFYEVLQISKNWYPPKFSYS